MADRALFSVSVTPIETVTKAVTYTYIEDNANHPNTSDASHDVLATEVGKSLGGSGVSIPLASGYARAANLQGYLDQAAYYVDAVHTQGGAAVTASAGVVDFVFIKNTGYRFSSTSELGLVTTDHVIVAIKMPAWSSSSVAGWSNTSNNGEIQYIEIGWLEPGEAMVLKLSGNAKSVTTFGAASNDLISLNAAEGILYVKTVLATGQASIDGNAVEFLCLT